MFRNRHITQVILYFVVKKIVTQSTKFESRSFNCMFTETHIPVVKEYLFIK